MWGNMKEWTFTLPRQLPLWEMESQWTPETSENDFRGQNSMSCDVLYIIGKLLKHKCLKWAHIAHLNVWNTSYGQKKARESNCQSTKKSRKSTQFTWLQKACNIPLESCRQELQICFKPHLDLRSFRKAMGFQSCGNLN